VPQPATPLLDNTLGGTAHNLAAVVPGADHPEETVIIGAHYDQTNDGPASTWDSAEGHAQILRVAKQMADYWDATNTRPSATIKFIPWAGEEAGTLGSRDYAENNIVPGEEDKVRGYWNTDPCAGGYPAYRYGNSGDRVKLGIQIARPTEVPDELANLRPRVTEFNNKAEQVVEDVFNKLDDTVPVLLPVPGTENVFISKAEGGASADIGNDVTIGTARPELFSSDWVNFLNKGVPFFNPGPEVTGPSDEGDANTPDGVATFHTPNDNQVTMNRYTGQATSVGNDAKASEAWAKGMEMCASLLSWGMLREDQAGAQTENGDVVAYYEALPNEAIARAPVSFDAGGSYQYADPSAHTFVPDSQLEYTWEFGDGATATGKVVEHAYPVAGTYTSKLTVRNTATNATDTMSIPITVAGATLAGPKAAGPAEDVDGFFDISWEFDEKSRSGFRRYVIEAASDLRRALTDGGENLPAGWTASDPTVPEITKWQHSDQPGTYRGNQKKSGARSFYTGVTRGEHTPGQGPNSGLSKLTLKSGIQLARDAELTYWSSFVNDLNDTGVVQAAIDDGSADEELDWEVVDRVTTTDFFNIPQDEATYPTQFVQRRVDLGKFAGQKIKLRFVYQLGPAQYVNVQRAGWYIDDFQVDTGTFRDVGETAAKSLRVGPLRKGLYSFRVRAVFADTATLPSNYATTNVTVGTEESSGGGPGVIPLGPGASRCSVTNGFRSMKVQRRGRGLRFTFARRVNGRVRVDVFRYVRGRKITRRTVKAFRNRTKSFTWNGRGKGVRNGVYYARIAVPTAGRQSDVRYVALVRRKGRFVVRPGFVRRPSCGLLRRFQLGQAVFGGRRRQGLRVVYELAQAGTVRVELLRGRRVVKRASRRVTRPGTYASVLGSRGLRGGEYRVRITVVSGAQRVVNTLRARRI
jgi:PKD repeat protein